MNSKVILSFLIIFSTLLKENSQLENCSGSAPVVKNGVNVCCNSVGDANNQNVIQALQTLGLAPEPGTLYGLGCSTLDNLGNSCTAQPVHCDTSGPIIAIDCKPIEISR